MIRRIIVVVTKAIYTFHCQTKITLNQESIHDVIQAACIVLSLHGSIITLIKCLNGNNI